MIGILPAAGNAKRMMGFPKFLLPILTKNTTLISWHVENQLKFCEKVIIVTNPENYIYLKHFIKNKRIEVVVTKTETMSETILKAIKMFPSEEYLVGMPDTFFVGENPYEILSNHKDYQDFLIALWKIQDDQIGEIGQVLIDENNNVVDVMDKSSECTYKFCWGVMKFNKKIIDSINKDDQHIGFAIMPSVGAGFSVKAVCVSGKYFDCATIEKYQKLLNCLHNTDLSV